VAHPHPVSRVQADAIARGELPPLEEMGDGVWSLSLPFGDGHDDHTLGYILEGADGSLCLIDPGWGTPGNITLIDESLRLIGHTLADVGLVGITHLHVDHIGTSESIRRASGARIAMHPAEQDALRNRPAGAERDTENFIRWAVPPEHLESLSREWGPGRTFPSIEADLLLNDGDPLPIPGRTITAVWTPGHTTGHLCYSDADARLLFTGDHVMPRTNPGIGLGGYSDANPVAQFLDSLDRVATEFGGEEGSGSRAVEACPGHDYRFTGLAERAAQLHRHRMRRGRDVEAALDALDHPTLWEVAAALPWRAGWRAFTGYRLGSALAQTQFHVDLLERGSELRIGSGRIPAVAGTGIRSSEAAFEQD
jgi:glyoxylase-like metal-dependent hydrolase (beta-lactamase superfamily II)